MKEASVYRALLSVCKYSSCVEKKKGEVLSLTVICEHPKVSEGNNCCKASVCPAIKELAKY